jgi:IclR helix-turn-helix domain
MRRGKTKVASRYPTPALEKGLDILELFAREPAGLTKSDVARRLGTSPVNLSGKDGRISS